MPSVMGRAKVIHSQNLIVFYISVVLSKKSSFSRHESHGLKTVSLTIEIFPTILSDRRMNSWIRFKNTFAKKGVLSFYPIPQSTVVKSYTSKTFRNSATEILTSDFQKCHAMKATSEHLSKKEQRAGLHPTAQSSIRSILSCGSQSTVGIDVGVCRVGD